MDIALIIALALWATLSIANQFRGVRRFLGPWDIFSLLPVWTFFAPNPGSGEYHVLVEDERLKSAQWIEVPSISERLASHILWNPLRRESKAIIDCVQHLTTYAASGLAPTAAATMLSIPFLAIFQYTLTGLPPATDACRRRVMVVKSFGRSTPSEPRVVFVSSWCKVNCHVD